MSKERFKFFHPLWLILLGINLIQADDIDDTLTLMKQSDKNTIKKKFNEAVFVFGDAGSGKTILTRFIADDDENLFSKVVNGDMIIHDVTGFGSNNIVAQEKKYPQLLVDNITDIPYYDFPSLNLASNMKSDVSSAYFINKAVSNTDSIKIVFVLEDLEKLNELIKCVSKFFENFDVLENGIALILTKASNEYIKSQAIAKLNTLALASGSVKERQIINEMLKNIGVFLKPKQSGKLSELSDMVQNKNELKQLLSFLQFKKIKLDNFNYSFFNQKWGPEIRQILERINLLKSNVVNEEVKEYFKGEEVRLYDFQQFRLHVAQREQRMIEIIESLKKMSDPFDVEKQVMKYLYEIIVEIPKELLVYSQISDFLVSTNTKELIRKSTEWISQLQSTVDYLKDLRNIFNVFNFIFDDIPRKQMAIWTYGNTTREQINIKIFNGEKIKGGDLRSFIDNVYDGSFLSEEKRGYFNSIENVELNDMELGIFYEIFKEASFFAQTKSCTDDEVVFEGNYVSMSDIYNENCRRKKVSVYAFNSLNFDVPTLDLDYDKAELAIIAPNWKVHGYIQLNVGKKRVDNALDYGGGILTIGGAYTKGSSIHMYSFGGEIDNFGPLYNNTKDAERPCGLLKKDETTSPSDDSKYCKDYYDSMIRNANGHSFSDRGHIIIRYKNAIINNLENKYQRNESLTFLLAINEIDEVYHHFTIPDFIEELQVLEKHYQTFKKKELLKPLYENLQFWIMHSINNMKDLSSEQFIDYKILYRYLYSVTLGKILAINSNSANSFVVDIDVYLGYILGNIELMEKNNMQIAVDNTKAKYQEQLNQKIDEGNKFIENHITPRIKDIQKNIIDAVGTDLVNEIKDVQASVIAEMKQIKAKMWQVAIAGILGFVGTICTIFGGPIGIAAGTMLNMGSAVISSMNIRDKSAPIRQVPQDLTSKLKFVNQVVGDYEKEREEVFSATMNYLQGAKVTDRAIQDAYTKIVTIKAANPDDRLKLTHGVLDDHIKKLKKEHAREKIKNPEAPVPPALANFKTAKNFANVAEVGTKVFLQVKDDVEKMDALGDLLEEKKQELENLKKLRATVSNQFVPLLKNISKELNEKIAGLRTQSRISLEVHKWKIKDALSDLRIQLQILTNGFQVQAQILNYVSKLGEAIDLVIAIFDKIQSYEEHKRFSDYISDIVHPMVDFNEVIQDPILKTAKNDLDLMLKRNVLFENYQNAINGLKQHVFPFAQLYLEQNVVSFTINDTENIDQTITRLSTHVKEMKTTLKRFKSTIRRDYQKYIERYLFYSFRTYTPFFVWRNEEYGPIIKSLMSGEEVVLKADITSSTKNAVKFNKIDLLFKSYNADVQKYLDDKLLDYKVILTHMGNSYYKCEDKIFVVPSESLTIMFGFAQDENGKLRTRSLVKDILDDSYFLLSPYAMWTIQLQSIGNNGFAAIEDLSNTVSLELSGDGEYVSDNAPICKTNLESYYQLDSTYYLRKNNLLE